MLNCELGVVWKHYQGPYVRGMFRVMLRAHTADIPIRCVRWPGYDDFSSTHVHLVAVTVQRWPAGDIFAEY
jgi:hypothetical protein